MPRGDGTGPPGGRTPRGGRNAGNRPGAGPTGACVCPSCGEQVPHEQGIPLLQQKLPEMRDKINASVT